MKVTFNMRHQALLDQLSQTRTRLDRHVRELATGRRVLTPSSDPEAASRIQRLREEIASTESIRQGLTRARGRLETTEGLLGDAVGILDEIRRLALQGGNPATGDELDIVATQVEALRESLMQVANSRYHRSYVFGGTATTTVPFLDDGTYQGNAGENRVPLDDGDLPVNIPGDAIFRGGPDAVQAIDDLVAALRAGDTAAIATAGEQVGEGLDHVSSHRAVIGTRLDTLARIEDRLDGRTLDLQTEAEAEGAVDLVQAITDLERVRATEQTILQTFSVVGRISLFDYLG